MIEHHRHSVWWQNLLPNMGRRMIESDEGGAGMASGFPEMTEKMQMLYMDIIASLGTLPPEKKIYIFGDDDNVDMEWVVAVANYITLEFIKYSYDYTDPVYPLRHFLGGDTILSSPELFNMF